MNDEQLNRKLTAILSADAKGYSRLMGKDDVAIVQTLKNCHKIMNAEIQRHHGRVIDSPGDNLLAEFASNTVFKLKGKSVDVRDVGRDLNVAYVLEAYDYLLKAYHHLYQRGRENTAKGNTTLP